MASVDKKVVVIGGGLSSKHLAELLVKDKSIKVTIIQANKFVEWPLAMTVVITKPELHDKVLAPNSATYEVPNVTYKYGVVKVVEAKENKVTLQNGESVDYDALVVATGFRMPLIYPNLGVSIDDRKAEIKRVNAGIRDGSTIVVAGGGLVGLELVGDLKAEFPSKRIVLLSRSKLIPQWPEEQRAKVEKQLKAMNIEHMTSSDDAPTDYKLEKGVLAVNGQDLAYDIYIPAFSQGPNTQFLVGTANVLDTKGRVMVNEFLQCKGEFNTIFALGCSDVNEQWVGMPKLEAQWNTLGTNIKNFLQGKPMKAHKEGMPEMKLPAVVMIGHGPKGYAWMDFSGVPPPVKCCCCCGVGGFPCCPAPCCWPCCGPCLCGYCFGPPEGNGMPKFMATMAFKSFGFHFKGGGEPPKQQTMA